MNKKDKNKTILTIISTSAARKPNLKLPIPPLQAQLISTFPHRHRTQPDRFPNAIQSDSERNPIGHRTRNDDFSSTFTERMVHHWRTVVEHVHHNRSAYKQPKRGKQNAPQL